MNLFLLSKLYFEAATWACDTHTVKMVLEATQVLYAAWHVNRGKLPKIPSGEKPAYKLNHKNHPITKWVRESPQNYMWTLNYALELAKEYSYRYSEEGKAPKVHGCVDHLIRLKEWGFPTKTCIEEVQEPPKKKIKKEPTVYATIDIPKGTTPFPLCFGKEGKKFMVKREGKFSGVLSYREYYRSKPASFKKKPFGYKKRKWPEFML